MKALAKIWIAIKRVTGVGTDLKRLLVFLVSMYAHRNVCNLLCTSSFFSNYGRHPTSDLVGAFDSSGAITGVFAGIGRRADYYPKELALGRGVTSRLFYPSRMFGSHLSDRREMLGGGKSQQVDDFGNCKSAGGQM